nr:hypothetical protein [Tanacetum cinerariifolium]
HAGRPDKDTSDFDSVFVIGKMQASLQGKDNTTDSQITKLTDHVTHLQAQNDLFRAENDKIKQHYKELNNRDAHLDYLRHLKESVEIIRDIVEEAKVVRTEIDPFSLPAVTLSTPRNYWNMRLALVLKALNNELNSLPKKQVIVSKPSDKSEQLPLRLRNNRDAHLDYLRHLKESVEIICDIVEEAKVVRTEIDPLSLPAVTLSTPRNY